LWWKWEVPVPNQESNPSCIVPVPSQESDRSCTCVLGISMLPLSIFFYWILKLMWQCGIFLCFSFYFQSTWPNYKMIQLTHRWHCQYASRVLHQIIKQNNWSHVGFKGRFQVYKDILQEVTTQYGYYLIDGGSYIQYSKDE
jgi:hypothetical protein